MPTTRIKNQEGHGDLHRYEKSLRSLHKNMQRTKQRNLSWSLWKINFCGRRNAFLSLKWYFLERRFEVYIAKLLAPDCRPQFFLANKLSVVAATSGIDWAWPRARTHWNMIDKPRKTAATKNDVNLNFIVIVLSVSVEVQRLVLSVRIKQINAAGAKAIQFFKSFCNFIVASPLITGNVVCIEKHAKNKTKKNTNIY